MSHADSFFGVVVFGGIVVQLVVHAMFLAPRQQKKNYLLIKIWLEKKSYIYTTSIPRPIL